MKKPNNVFAPLVIAGITVGFLASAYKYIFRHKPTQDRAPTSEVNAQPQTTVEPVADHSAADVSDAQSTDQTK